MNQRRDAIVVTNTNNGLYVRGRSYSLQKKLEVDNSFNEMFCDSECRHIPTAAELAAKTQISRHFAAKVIAEINTVGNVIDPEKIHEFYYHRNKRIKIWKKLQPEHTRFLLALREEQPERPIYNYIFLLDNVFGVRVSNKTISNFFNTNSEFGYSGNFVCPNRVSLDKFVDKNILKVYKYREIIRSLVDHVK